MNPLPPLLLCCLSLGSAVAAPSCQASRSATAPTVVELYTSEGCSSCPPADKWLSTLKGKPDVLALAFHVNYWDRLGWPDRFASAELTARQHELAQLAGSRQVYTPQVVANGRDWRVVTGYGHSPEHAALYCGELGVLIAGDMVLPRISTNVSVQPYAPDADPLGRFLDSLTRYADLAADTLVLPSHGLPFHGLRERVAALTAHHAARLDELLVADRKSVV